MAVTQLADVYVGVPFNKGVDEAATELNAFLASGVLGTDPITQAEANGTGKTGEIPFYTPLDASGEPNYSSDNSASSSTPAKITGGKQIYRKNFSNKSWSTMDLTRELALADPLAAITGKIGQYWATQTEKRVIKSAMGVLADNVANDSGDMLYSIATDSVSAITDAERISPTAVLTAKATMGDHAELLSVIAMHSVVYTNLQKQNLITFIPNARGEVNIPTYLGYRVVVDDSMPAIAGTNRITYTTILFALGAFSYATGTPAVPSELLRVPAAGDGGGQDILFSRRTELIHPQGFQMTGSPAGASATLTELAAATSWDRVVARKNVGMAFLQTNG